MNEFIPVATKDGMPGSGEDGATVPVQTLGAPGCDSHEILLVIPSRLFRDGIKSMLQSPQLTFIGECGSLADASVLLQTCGRPDIIIVAFEAVGDVGEQFQRLREMRAQLPGTRWAMLSQAPSHKMLRQAIDAGIDGILQQDTSSRALRHVVALMLLGHPFVPTEFARFLTRGEGQAGEAAPQQGENVAPGQLMRERSLARFEPDPALAFAPPIERSRMPNLSDREAEILKCLVNGSSNKVIARDLRIAEATVKVHIKGLLRKMQLQNRTQAAIWALNNPFPANCSSGNVVELPVKAARVGVPVPVDEREARPAAGR